ncbi:MAG: methyl-accepting chemotaxis protein [Lachnospiraceae bacterium]|nr:methyl-accepting chemotaxis protein [bacterium]MDY5517817.1 methyl-accepting chemotaxis protein [Lachnospiraceae bacterium]
MREQHLSDQNRMAKIISIVILASMLFISFLAFVQQIRPDMIVRTIILIVAIVVNIVGYRVFRTSETYRHIVSVSTFIGYLAFIFTYRDTFVFAYIFPIAVMIMIFQDKRVIKLSALLAVLANLVFFITFQLRFPGQVSNQVVIVEMALVIVAAVTSVFIITMQQKHGEENTEEIEERAAQQAQVAAEVVRHSRNLADKFQQAMTVSDTLNECMDSSHSSVSEIADSTRLTAEAIEQQTTQTVEIQHHVQQVEEQTRQMANLSEATKETVEQGVELIRQLKEQATEQISAIISRLISDAENASVSMSQSAAYAEKQNEMIAVTGDKLRDIQKNSDALNGNVMRVSQAVGDVVTANTAISDSISNLSATSEEVAASTESSLALSDSSMNALKEMNDLLNEIYSISENMMKLSE